MHGTMDYMSASEPLRSNPEGLLPGVQSILAVTLNYNSGESSRSGPRVARYALGRDYHKVLRAKLKKIAAWAEADNPGLQARPCVDSAPILERDYAWLAGLGWFGKNTMLIDTKRGSWFFIGLLLLSEHFEPDAPEIGSCGTCRTCIDACPTGALVIENGRPIATLDASRCISYQTIEHHGPLTENTHGWLFGCDICQEVCPFNHARANSPLRAVTTKVDDFAPRTPNTSPDLAAISQMDRAAFESTYAGTALMRAGIERMQRNVEALLQPERCSDR